MKYENKMYEVRRYRDFPHKGVMDVVIKTFSNSEDAKYDSLARNRSLKEGNKGFYMIDNPHTQIFATPEQELAWEKAKKKCGLMN